jgi:hypothetical protein
MSFIPFGSSRLWRLGIGPDQTRLLVYRLELPWVSTWRREQLFEARSKGWLSGELDGLVEGPK